MKNRNGDLLSYDEQQQLTSYVKAGANTITFGYSYNGTRLWKSSPGTSYPLTVWIGSHYEEKGGKTLCHVYAENELVCTFEPQGGSYAQISPLNKLKSVPTAFASAFEWAFTGSRTVFAAAAIPVLSITAILALCAFSQRTSTRSTHFLRPVLRRCNFSYQILSLTLIVCMFLGSVPTNVEATVPPAAVFYYYHSDFLNSSSVLVDRNGQRVQKYVYGAFGHGIYTENSSVYPISNRYTGKVLDDETGLSYYNTRYYDPSLGRFIQPDTLLPQVYSSQLLNLYTYCSNNPYKYNDPTGHEPADWGRSINETIQSWEFGLTSNGTGWGSILWNTTLGSTSTAAQMFPDLLLFGDSVGSVSGNPNATRLEWAGAIITDLGRGATIAGGAGAAAAKGLKAASILGQSTLAATETDFMAGRLGGELYSADKLKKLESYLDRRGFKLQIGDEFLPAGKAGGFNATERTVMFRSNPTKYEVWHELSHFNHLRKTGPDAYIKLSPIQKEQYVFDFINNSPKRWGALNFDEQQHAIGYILRIGGIR
jgi:RHS repeat-associated protein